MMTKPAILDRIEMPLMLHDFVSGQLVCIDDALATDEAAMRVIPQWPGARGLYKLYRDPVFGKTIEEALIAVLETCTKEPE